MPESSRFGAPAAGGVCCAVMLAVTCIALAGDRLTPADDALLRTMSDELVAAPRLEYDMAVNVRFTMTGWQQLTDTSLHVSAERPNRLAMRVERGVAGGTLVSDGETLWTFMPMQFAYEELEAPETLKGLRDVQSTFFTSRDGALSGMMFGVLLAQEDPYHQIMDGVTSVRRLERETVDGIACEVLEFTEDQGFTWKLAVTAEAPHRPRRCTVDLSSWYESNAANNPAYQGATYIVTTSFSNWEIPTAFAADRFAFAPPEGAMNMSDAFDFDMGGNFDADGNSPVHAMLGAEAPPFELSDLDAEDATLEAHLGKDVVVLDFWATWCPPCVQALPMIEAVAKEYADKGVVVYAVNQQEEAGRVRSFLRKKGLELDVLFDTRGTVGQAYGVSGIPQTIVIGLDGTIQVVHVGFSPSLGDDLRKELDALLVGEDLAAQAVEAAKPHGLEVAWTAAGEFSGVAVHGERVFAVGMHGLVELGPDGDVVRTVRRKVSPMDVGVLRLAELTGDDEPDFVLFRQWGSGVYALDSDGNELWTYPGGQGIDDVWPVDVDGDGLHEIAIGHNGNTGLHLVDASGEARWTNRGLGNVWHVTGGDLDGDGAMEVISTSAEGSVHVFDAAGKSVKTIRPSGYANMVRFVEAPASETALVCSGGMKCIAFGLDATGKELWSTPLAGPSASAAVARAEPWAAIAAMNGAVEIVHLDSGDALGRLSVGMAPSVAWLETDGRSRLVVAARGLGVKAYDVVENVVASE